VHDVLKDRPAAPMEFRQLDNTAPGRALCLTSERTQDDATLVEAAV